jgi:predicted nucleotide-binding protein
MANKRSQASARGGREATKLKRSYLKQGEVPALPLSEALRLAQSLHDDFADGSAAPHSLAMAVDLSPTAQTWKDLSGASIAYGLTEGGSQARVISLTDLGKRIVAPVEEGQDAVAKVEAALSPRLLRLFFEKYNRAKFPQDKIALNVLADLGVPKDRLERALDIIKRNGEFVGVVHQTKTGPFVAIDTPLPPARGDGEIESEADVIPPAETKATVVAPKPTAPVAGAQPGNQRVFITHGKNKDIVNQLKDLLTFGKLVPVVAEEHETISKPVPEKVLEEMRSCFAGIIHVAGEEELLDSKGGVHHKVNENVLIEIGAAMALYRNNFILLVQQGIHLPSNLQGLYICWYEGDKLDYEATMKLLKAFNEFR